jgi:hypothetical protein
MTEVTLHFKKGWNHNKPNRWYIFGDTDFTSGFYNIFNFNYGNEPLITYHKHSWEANQIIRALKAQNINACMTTRDSDAVCAYRLFVYNRSHADDAAFIIKASDGVTIDI